MSDQLNYRVLLEKIDRAFSERAFALCLESIKELVDTDSRLVEKYRIRIRLLEWHQEKSKKAQGDSSEMIFSTPHTIWYEDKTTSVAKFQNEISKCIGFLKKDEIIDSLMKSISEEEKSEDLVGKIKMREIKIKRKSVDLKEIFIKFRNELYGNLPSEIESADYLFNQGSILISHKFDDDKNVEVEMRIEEAINMIKLYYIEGDIETEFFVDYLSDWWNRELKKVKLFVSYSHRDSEWKIDLLKQFYSMNKLGIIDKFDDSMIKPGQEWEPRLLDRMANSDIILFLVSPDLLHSEYIDKKELPLAEKLHRSQKSVVIPIFVRWINVEGTFLGQIQGFPNANYGYRFLDKAPNREEALYHVVLDVGKFVNEIYSKR